MIIYVTLLETLQAKGRTYALTRFVVKYKQLIGWGVPGIITGVLFAVNKNPDSKNGVTCWFRGISNSHPEMWITNLAGRKSPLATKNLLEDADGVALCFC